MVHFYSPTKKVWGVNPSIMEIVLISVSSIPFIVQIFGSGMVGPLNGPKSQQMAIDIYMVGIGLQQVVMLCAFGLIIKFHFDMAKSDRLGHLTESQTGWRPLIYTLYSSLTAIAIRIDFRLVEFSGGFAADKVLPHKEVYFYGFEALPMLLVLLFWNVVHPGKYLQGPDSDLPPNWLSKVVWCFLYHKDQDISESHFRLDNNNSNEELTELILREPSWDGERTAQNIG
jgi:hypothetical protein